MVPPETLCSKYLCSVKGHQGIPLKSRRVNFAADTTNNADEIKQQLKYIPSIPKPYNHKAQNSCKSDFPRRLFPPARTDPPTLAKHFPSPQKFWESSKGVQCAPSIKSSMPFSQSSLRKLAPGGACWGHSCVHARILLPCFQSHQSFKTPVGY